MNEGLKKRLLGIEDSDRMRAIIATIESNEAYRESLRREKLDDEC
jgi:hypothetical protein